MTLALLTALTLRDQSRGRHRLHAAAARLDDTERQRMLELRVRGIKPAAKPNPAHSSAVADPAKVVPIRRKPQLLNRSIESAENKVPAVVERRTRGLKPVTGLLSDPRLARRLQDIVGMYLSSPEHAVVLCCDGSSPLNGMDFTRIGLAHREDSDATSEARQRNTLDPVLAEALSNLYGSVIGGTTLSQRRTAWLKFMSDIDQQMPRTLQLHVICDNRTTNDHPDVQKWRTAHPRFNFHFVSGPDSGLHMVRRVFTELIAPQMGFGIFQSVGELIATISDRLRLRVPDASPLAWVASNSRFSQRPAVARVRTKRLRVKQIAAMDLGLDPSLLKEMFAKSRA
jgi:hypothetical protein